MAEGANAASHHFLIVTKDLGLLCLLRSSQFWISTQPVLISGGPFTGRRGSLMPPPLLYPVLPERWLSVMVTAPLERQVVLAETTERNVDYLLLYSEEAVVGRCPQGE